MRIPVFTALLLLLVSASAAAAQPSGTLIVTVQHEGSPVDGATVVIAGVEHRTNAMGQVLIAVAPGDVVLTVTAARLAPAALTLAVLPDERREVTVALEAQEAIEEHVVVSATRTGTRLEDQPLRVEVLEAEEIEEKIMMTPGDIVMMLNEMGGMRVQATAPSLGAASVRIQGMRGRYTRFLADGLPLFGEVGSLGLLQIPPMDLARVEVIKGVASSLYGAGAMGGVVNLISRRPGTEWEREAVVNRSSRQATDIVGWMGGPVSGRWTATILAGVHGQVADDVDEDGWADVPAYTRGLVRPRLFWEDGNGGSLHLTGGLTIEDRSGGTVDAGVLPATGAAYREALDTVSTDVGVVAQTTMGRQVVTARGAFAQQRHDHTFGEIRERDRHDTVFGEIAVRGAVGAHSWVAGAAVESEAYRPRDLEVFRYTHVVPGVFVQDDIRFAPWLSVSASGRLDHHSEYGTFVSPRIAALVRRGAWTSRLSVGGGFVGPSVLTEETEAAGLSRLTVIEPLRAEKGRALSFDLSRTMGPVTATATLFASRVSSPLHVTREQAYTLRSLDRPTTNRGVELVAVARHQSLSVTSTYAYVRSREQVGGSSEDVPLTPRHSSGVVAMWEREGNARIGFEWYYTGRQRLEDNPYRERSEPYSVIGLLAERRFGRFRLFVNGENLTNVRQTHWDSLVRPTRAADGRWATDAWAPLDGRTINGGARIAF